MSHQQAARLDSTAHNAWEDGRDGPSTKTASSGEIQAEVLADAKIMMVDDESITMEIVQAYLEDVGYRNFHLLEDSSIAMAAIEEQRPDVLLLDLMMPEVNGFDILKRVRAHADLKHLPVIVLTSSTDASTKLQALDFGATDFLAKPVDPSELALRVRNTLAAKAYQDQLAFYDASTGLPNRHLFVDRVSTSLRQAEQFDENVAVLHIVLDQFKRVYDTFGPATGDNVFKQVAQRISTCVEISDTVLRTLLDRNAETTLYRVGSEEFAIICPQVATAENAASLAKRVLRAMEQPFHAEATEVYISTSIGIAIYPADTKDANTLVRWALGASAQASAEGGNRYKFYSRALNNESVKRLKMEADLHRAIEKNELVLHYQPRVDLTSGNMSSVEALVRWQQPDGTLLMPGDFVPVAEDTGLIVPIGAWVLTEACAQLKRWEVSGAPLHIAVNLSTKQFLSGDLVQVVAKALHMSGADPSYLTLELTESLLTKDPDYAVETLNKLKALGTNISMDDFGTGYSSLGNLKRLPLDELKIDRSFVFDLLANKEDRAVVSAVVFLAHELGLNVVAEGVENQDQLDFLSKVECDEYQGYLYSRPLPVDELQTLISSKEINVRSAAPKTAEAS